MDIREAIAGLIVGRKVNAETAAMLNARQCDEALLQRIATAFTNVVDVAAARRLGIDDEERLAAACEYVAQQHGYSHWCLTHHCKHGTRSVPPAS